MKLVDLPLDRLREAPWNSNVMEPETRRRLKESVERFDVVENLIVRRNTEGYEVLSGNQRLQVLRELGYAQAPCVVVELDDAHARLLAQALNHLHGVDDLGLRAEALRAILEAIPQDEVLSILPETAESLKALASLSQETIAEHLRAWQRAQAARLKHLQFQLTPEQLEVVEKALARVLPRAKGGGDGNPNLRGRALYLLCKEHLEVRHV